jgi:hypothetical protein
VLDAHIGVWIVDEPLQPLPVLRFGARELCLPVGERDARPGLRERDRGLDRRVAASSHEHVRLGEVIGVVEPVIDAVSILAGHAERAVAPGPADRHDHAPGAKRLAVRAMNENLAARALEALDIERDGFDTGSLGLSRSSSTSGSFTVAVTWSEPRWLHRAWVGVDRLGLREIDDRGEGLPRFEELVGEAAPLGLDRGCDTRDSRADDDEVQDPAGVGALSPRSAATRSTARAPVSRENLRSGIPVRSPTTYTPGTDVEPSCALRQRLDRARRPAGVQPACVAGDRVHG